MASAASEANEAHQRRFAERVLELVGKGSKRVAILGLAFKAGTDDVRYSPALRVAELLIARGMEVVGYDPHAARNAAQALPGLKIADSPLEAMTGASVAVVATEWPELRDLDWGSAARAMARPVVLDGRRLLDDLGLPELGFQYEALGARKPAHKPVQSTAGVEKADSRDTGQAATSQPEDLLVR